MMRVDVVALQRFYASPLGAVARRMAARRLAAVWPHANGLDVLGLGYAPPYLEPYRAGARRAVALMPAAQGAEQWPADGPGLTALGEEARLPFADTVFDRVIVAHLLEESEAVAPLLREVWRVMAPEGRIVVIAANRAGLWARIDATPFGQGRPYSRRQLAQLLGDAMFEPTVSARAVFVPPVGWGPLLSAAEGFESLGGAVAPSFGGVLLMEAVKRLSIGPGRARPKVVLARARAQMATHRSGAPLPDRAVAAQNEFGCGAPSALAPTTKDLRG